MKSKFACLPSLFAPYFIVALARGRKEKEESAGIRLFQDSLPAIRKGRRPGDRKGKWKDYLIIPSETLGRSFPGPEPGP